jgi:hypothetical protein
MILNANPPRTRCHVADIYHFRVPLGVLRGEWKQETILPEEPKAPDEMPSDPLFAEWTADYAAARERDGPQMDVEEPEP